MAAPGSAFAAAVPPCRQGLDQSPLDLIQRQLFVAAVDLQPETHCKDLIWGIDQLKIIRDDIHLLLLGSGPQRVADRAGQWAPVTGALRSKRHRNVFVIGDAAGLPQPIGKQAYYALQMGVCAAENVERMLAGRRLRNFRPSAKGMLVAFGELDTFLIAGRSVIASPALAAVKEAVFQVTMAQLDPPLGGDALRGAARRFIGTARRRLLSP